MGRDERKCRGGLGLPLFLRHFGDVVGCYGLEKGVTIVFSRRTPFTSSTEAIRKEIYPKLMVGGSFMG